MERLRTIRETAAELKKQDPRCGLTEWAIRQLVADGKLPVLYAGNKALLSVESVERYINSIFGEHNA